MADSSPSSSPGPRKREDHLAPVVEHDTRLDVAGEQDEDRARVVALVEQDVAAPVAAQRAELLELRALVGRELAQEALGHRGPLTATTR